MMAQSEPGARTSDPVIEIITSPFGGGHREPAPPREATGRRIAVIANPATRMSANALARELAEWRMGLDDITLTFTDGQGTTELLARRAAERSDVVVAAGGDGTVGEVATALAHTATPMGIIPAGSTNIIAKELGIPARPGDALDLIARNHVILRMDLAFVNDRAMLHMAGAGFDSRLFAMTDPRLKRRFGWGAYFPAGIRASLARPASLLVTTEAETFRVDSPLILLANGASIISRHLRIDSKPTVDDGVLDLYIVLAIHPLPTMETLMHAMLGGLGDAPDVIYRQVTSVHIESDQPLPYQIDGDVMGNLPIDVTVAPHALRVIVPAARESVAGS